MDLNFTTVQIIYTLRYYLKSKFYKGLKEIFDIIDTNKDGLISLKELYSELGNF